MVKRKQSTPTNLSKRSKQDSKNTRQSRSTLSQNASKSFDETSRRSQKRKSKTPTKRKPGTVSLLVHGNKTIKMTRKTLQQIKILQRTTNFLIPRLPFSRLVREVMMDYFLGTNKRIQLDALLALQEAAEIYLVHLFQDANKCAMHAKRVTLKPRDMILVLTLRGCLDPGNH